MQRTVQIWNSILQFSAFFLNTRGATPLERNRNKVKLKTNTSTNIKYYSRDAYENKDRQFDFFASERFQKFRQFKVHNIQYSAESARDVNFVEEQMKAT